MGKMPIRQSAWNRYVRTLEFEMQLMLCKSLPAQVLVGGLQRKCCTYRKKWLQINEKKRFLQQIFCGHLLLPLKDRPY